MSFLDDTFAAEIDSAVFFEGGGGPIARPFTFRICFQRPIDDLQEVARELHSHDSSHQAATSFRRTFPMRSTGLPLVIHSQWLVHGELHRSHSGGACAWHAVGQREARAHRIGRTY